MVAQNQLTSSNSAFFMALVLFWDHESACLCCTEPVKPVHVEHQRRNVLQLKRVRAEETHRYVHKKNA